MQSVVVCNSPSDTQQLGRLLGSRLRGGEVITLASDLGGGKTTMVRGIAAGLGSNDHVSSPTFTLNKQYKAGQKTIQHFDFYRLPEPALMAYELADSLDDPSNIIIIEWADTLQHILPKDYLKVTIKRTGEDSRQISFDCPAGLDYLLEGIKARWY